MRDAGGGEALLDSRRGFLRRPRARHQRTGRSAPHVSRRAERAADRRPSRRRGLRHRRRQHRGRPRERSRAARRSSSTRRASTSGSVRLTERHVRDRSSRAAPSATPSAERLAKPSPPCRRCRARQTPVGIAGTMTTLAAVSLGLVPYDGARVHGHAMSRDELRARRRRARVDAPRRARRRVAGMEPKRADVIVAGGLIALALLEHWDAARCASPTGRALGARRGARRADGTLVRRHVRR